MNTPTPPQAEPTLSVIVPSALLSDPSQPEHMESLLNNLQQGTGDLTLQHLRHWLGSEGATNGSLRIVESVQTHDDTALSRVADAAMAQCFHLDLEDGLVPWAWHTQSNHKPFTPSASDLPQSVAPQEDPQGQALALVSLSHWHVASGQVIMQPAREITMQETLDIKNTLQPYFTGDGIELLDHRPGSWLARSALFKDLPSASLERVMGQDVNPWLIGQTAGPAQRAAVHTLRRLQSEVQMLLYHHPINASSLPPLNSIWFSGTGQGVKGWPELVQGPWPDKPLGELDRHQHPPNTHLQRQWLASGRHTVLLAEDLTQAHWTLDLAAWCQALEKIDQEVFAHLSLSPGVQVILCGLNYTKTWRTVPASAHQVAKTQMPWSNLLSWLTLGRFKPQRLQHGPDLEDILI